MISALMPNYNRADICFEHGQGAYLFDETRRRYLDFGAGIATSSLGHGHPHLVRAIAEQAAKVIHVSNLYRVKQAERLAARYVAASFADSVFFCNSGAEANEGLVKAMRKTQADEGHPERTRVICFEGAFHGRTLAMISATGNPKYLAGFGEPVPGFDHVPLNDIAAVRAAITPQTAGILVEPIQGEGGIRAVNPGFLQALRDLCDEHGLLLGFDEVQTGMGRTGKLFAHEWHGVTPDVLSSAKGIGGGFPMAAVLGTERVAKALVPGSHGTTYGGGPLACAAGNAVLDVILADGFLDQLTATAAFLRAGLEALVVAHPAVFTEVRGMGLLLGLKCTPPNGEVQAAALTHGLLTVAAGDNVLRLAPPLIIGQAECEEALALLGEVAAQLAAQAGAAAK
ncbi:aspartate aminotransferase family protein [Acidocella sp. KAb 2-4]|uniref:aspartate aminotransferase family protein n=1 Tax=Acidocella sp. KAb 2-4 TaxID=2885158 RepID=UPI001D06174F|nr:aspartate aminotransferase family protein [Acidocella sp. KAb 2-4]MCB5943795.1 aspartate aminotransferase family protein [Acidocella sp. KAb 2-4]